MSTPAQHPLGGFYYGSAELRAFGFKRVGENVRVHSRASVYCPENVELGDHVRIDDFTVIVATGPLALGSFVHIPTHCFIGSRYGIVMEDYATLAPHVQLYTASDDYHGGHLTGAVVPRELTGGDSGPIMLRRHVLLGAGAIVLPNCDIGEGAAVGSLSLVKHSLEPWHIYGGVPARQLAERKRDLLSLVPQASTPKEA